MNIDNLVERCIVRTIVFRFLDAGYELRVDDGGDEFATPWTRDAAVAMDALMNTAEDYLFALKNGKQGWVRLIYGNEPWAVVCDYNTSLNDVMDGINELTDEIIEEES